MFNILKTQHVLAVDDYAANVAYFTEKLGFTLNNEIDGWAFLSLGDFHIMLGDCQGEMLAEETRSHSWFAYVNCTGIDDIYNDMKKRGAEIREKLMNKPWGLREFLVATPEGHRIKFGQEL
jgi:uncharacterized glyoxalase superfamily protein PhnB